MVKRRKETIALLNITNLPLSTLGQATAAAAVAPAELAVA